MVELFSWFAEHDRSIALVLAGIWIGVAVERLWRSRAASHKSDTTPAGVYIVAAILFLIVAIASGLYRGIGFLLIIMTFLYIIFEKRSKKANGV